MRTALIRKFLSDVRASYWFIPVCLVVLAVLAAIGLLYVDAAGYAPFPTWPRVFPRHDVEGTRTVLSVISQSIIGVAGVMFSITMVAVAHASSQFGPRLIGNFMRDRGNQWSLGILISSFVYSIIILRSVSGSDTGAEFIPDMSLLGAFVLTFASVGTVIYYVHHVPETINVANIAAGLGQRLVTKLQESRADPEVKVTLDRGAHETQVSLGKAGYLQQVDIAGLTRIAERFDTFIELQKTPGTFVNSETSVAVVHSAAPDVEALVRPCFALGRGRTEEQDLTFLFDQQVEMVARALSPGINDPQTAINCLNWFGSALVVADRSGTEFGLPGTERVITPKQSWADLLWLSFGTSWDYVQDDRLARTRWSGILDELSISISPQNVEALERFRSKIKDRS